MLVDHFVSQFNRKYGKQVRSVDPKVMRLLLNYQWPGNVRELQRCMEHAFVFVKGPVIFARYLPDIHEFQPERKALPSWSPDMKNPNDKNAIIWALSRSGGKRKEAAELLGISRTSLWRKMKSLGMSK